MIKYLAYLPLRYERDIDREIQLYTARYTDEKLEGHTYCSLAEIQNSLMSENEYHLIIWDIDEVKESLQKLKEFRRKHRLSMLIIIAREETSPLVYLIPQISPDGLLLKPFSRGEVGETLDPVFEELNTRFFGSNEKTFVVERREGNAYIPLDKIDYFEAREKKIFLRSGREEYGFYCSLDELQTRLPEYFVRCHRSYIVNSHKIKLIDNRKNEVILWNRSSVLISRTYRKNLKEHYDG